jgi:FtsZ-interacting cell division protein YlmF
MKQQISLLALSLLLMLVSCQPVEREATIENKTNDVPVPYQFETSDWTAAALQQDPNVTWMGEVILDYAPEYHRYSINKEEKELLNEMGVESINRVKTLKLQLADLDERDWDIHNLSVKILSGVNQIDCYKDENLTQKCTKEELKKVISSVDTIITFDPKTFEEIVQVVVNEVDPANIYTFKLKQLIYYDKAQKTFRAMPVAIAPVLTRLKRDGSVASSEPLFWFHPKALNTTPDLNMAGLDYAKRIYCQVESKNIKVIKGEASMGEVLISMIEDIDKASGTHYMGHTFDADGNLSLTEEEVGSIVNSVDTIITFDPKTFEEIVQVVVNVVDAQKLNELRLIQDWVWNADAKEIGINFVGFAPIIDRFDDAGNFLNSGPMFIRRPDRDK